MKCALLGCGPTCFDFAPFARLDLIAEQVIEALLVRVHAAKDEDGLVHDHGRVSVARFRTHTLKASDLEPEVRRETVLVDIVHGVMAIPASDHEHRVVADDGSVSEPIQRLRPVRRDLLPLVLLLFESAFPEIIIPGTAIVARKHIQRAVVKNDGMIGPWTRLLSDCCNAGPGLLI